MKIGKGRFNTCLPIGRGSNGLGKNNFTKRSYGTNIFNLSFRSKEEVFIRDIKVRSDAEMQSVAEQFSGLGQRPSSAISMQPAKRLKL